MTDSVFPFGVLVDSHLSTLQAQGAIVAVSPLLEGQIQPASMDLRLGPKAYRVQAGFLPKAGARVEEHLRNLSMYELDLTQPTLLEKGGVYVVPLQEGLKLPAGIWGAASPKSSTGRLDIFVRLLLDGVSTYDTVPAGYAGPMYLEISPLTFPIVVRAGDRLSQLRLRHGEVTVNDAELTALHQQTPLMRNLQMPLGADDMAPHIGNGLWFSIDLHGKPEDANPIIGYRAKHHTQPVDLARVGGYGWHNFWEPICRNQTSPLILYPEEFYIFCSREGVCIPPGYAAEMVAYDTRVGEIRVHYAGFFDPGFGYDAAGGLHGTTAVLEVRAHDVPCVLEDGQPIGRFLYEKLAAPSTTVYGSGIGSNYAGQGLKLAKQFIMD
ncbi:MAG: 2'-deoxycytidine 5'-triphosphate deaminase [Pseudomonadaceae bacterium]|nr:2'-deoxycytidine 5'-triphosphate deaminase [Pseudomonadaceae bacterium]